MNMIAEAGRLLLNDVYHQISHTDAPPTEAIEKLYDPRTLALQYPGWCVALFLFDAESIRTIVTLSHSTKQQLSGGVLSLAELPNYVDTGEALLDAPYLTQQSAASVAFPAG
jgi:hypothetical protein